MTATVMLALFAAACDPAPVASPESDAPASPGYEPAPGTAGQPAGPAAPPSATPSLWLTEELGGPVAEAALLRLLVEPSEPAVQADSGDTGDPGSTVDADPTKVAESFNDDRESIGIVLRPGDGPTSITRFLGAQARAFPDRLPDVVALPLHIVQSAGQSGLLRPLPDGVLADRAADSFPFSIAAVKSEEGYWALPIALDVLVAAAPATDPAHSDLGALLEDIPEQGAAPLAIPDGVSMPETAAVLQLLYAAAGGEPADLPNVVPRAASAAISAAAQAVRLDTAEIGPGSLSDALDSQSADAVLLAATRIVPSLAGDPAASLAALPPGASDSMGAPVGWGWALALPAMDAASRHGRGEALLERLSGQRSDAWIVAAGLLPARRNGWSESAAVLSGSGPALGQAAWLAQISDQLESAALLHDPSIWLAGWRAALDGVRAGTPAADAASSLPQQ